jgi:transglutaminase-like putative cysteine protease
MFRAVVVGGALVATMSAPALAGSNEVQYAKAPDWVAAQPSPTTMVPPPGAQVRVAYQDFQIHAGPDGDEIFSAWRMRILKPEALAVGNISLAWNPDAGDATVHYLRILRDGKPIDVLASTKFQVLRREADLENAVLNGNLTAVLQVPGLQVGDDLEFAATVRHKDLTLGDHSFGAGQLPIIGLSGAFRVRLLWPDSRRLTWRTASDVPVLQETRRGGQKELIYELRDPEAVILAAGAPLRMNLRRFVEYSDFGSWREVSGRIWPLYEKSSALPKASPIREEISRIATSTTDSVRRTEAALQLVQDRIRYVYVGMDGGNLRPATIDETWTRRFGDCKAKTALLVAMLTELGIQAEPVLVNSQGGDGANERLPSPAMFDHVVVRARIGAAVHWLDGTRSGDKSLGALWQPIYRWVLPLRAGGADLEAVPSTVPRVPDSITVLEIDAHGGFEARVPIKADAILRGDEALSARTALSGMTRGDAERAIRTFWDQRDSDIESETASWRFDEQGAVVRLSVVGTIKLDWDGDAERGYSLGIFGAGFTPPAEYRRPKEQDQTAPWVTEYPAYRCWATAIRLPPSSARWKWDYRANPVNRTLGGSTYWRVSDLRDGVVRTVMSRRYDVPEISSAEAQEVNRLLPTFDNNISRVYQIAVDKTPAVHAPLVDPPFGEATDWMSPVTPCGAAVSP